MALYRNLHSTVNSREFRLLKIDSDGGQLHCESIYYKIHNAPRFIAMSYTWGSALGDKEAKRYTSEAHPAAREELTINGHVLPVEHNLVEGLRTVVKLHPGEVVFAWVDALCINQENIQERAMQVSMMGEIYSRAEKVLVWLGRGTETSDLAMQFIKELSEIKDAEWEKVLAFAMARRNKAQWTALMDLLERRWWTRTWVLQETILARHIEFICGDTSMEGDTLSKGLLQLYPWPKRLAKLLNNNFSISLAHYYASLRSVAGMAELRAKRLAGEPLGFLACHMKTLTSRATDPRDYIFAKLGFACDADFVVPDYKADVVDVYTQFVAGYIHQSKSLDIIHIEMDKSREAKHKLAGLPSWVPDWSCADRAFQLANMSRQPEETGLAPRSNARQIIHQGSLGCMERVLKCWGHIYDKVQANILPKLPGHALPVHETVPGCWPGPGIGVYRDESEVCRAIYSCFLASRHRGEAKSTNYGALGRELFDQERRFGEDGPPAGHPGQDTPLSRLHLRYASMREFPVQGRPLAEWVKIGPERLGLPEKKTDELMPMACIVRETLHLRGLLTTERGYVGVASYKVRPGDYVALLEGSSLPVVLRPSRDAPGKYKLVCGAYIHGITGDDLAPSTDIGSVPRGWIDLV